MIQNQTGRVNHLKNYFSVTRNAILLQTIHAVAIAFFNDKKPIAALGALVGGGIFSAATVYPAYLLGKLIGKKAGAAFAQWFGMNQDTAEDIGKNIGGAALGWAALAVGTGFLSQAFDRQQALSGGPWQTVNSIATTDVCIGAAILRMFNIAELLNNAPENTQDANFARSLRTGSESNGTEREQQLNQRSLRQRARNLGQLAQELRQWTQELGQLAQELGQLAQELGQWTQELGQRARNLGQLAQELGQLEQELRQRERNLGQRERNLGQ